MHKDSPRDRDEASEASEDTNPISIVAKYHDNTKMSLREILDCLLCQVFAIQRLAHRAIIF